MSDAEKLSRPSFARYDAGMLIGGDLAPQTDFMRKRDVTYEVIYLPEHHPVRSGSDYAADLGAASSCAAARRRSRRCRSRQRAPSPLAERASAVTETLRGRFDATI